MALTEAEKRQALRERRAAKMANSNARLQKITGDSVHATKTEASPAPAPSSPSPSSTGTSTPEPSSSASSSRPTGSRNRISQAFNAAVYDDPPEEDLEQFQKSLNDLLTSEKHKHQEQEEQAGMQEINAFAKLMGMNPETVREAASGAEPGADPMLALLQKAGMANGQGGIPQIDPNATQGAYEHNAEEVEFEKAKSDKFKAQFMLMKLITLVTLCGYFFFHRGHHSSSTAIQRSYEDSLFTQVLTGLEVLSVSYYAAWLHKLPEHYYNYNSKIMEYLGLVPEAFLPAVWKGRIKLGIKYLELFQLLLFDISVVVIMFGVLSYLH